MLLGLALNCSENSYNFRNDAFWHVLFAKCPPKNERGENEFLEKLEKILPSYKNHFLIPAQIELSSHANSLSKFAAIRDTKLHTMQAQVRL